MTDAIQALREAEEQAKEESAYAIRDQALVRAFQLVADEMGHLHPDDIAAILRRVKGEAP